MAIESEQSHDSVSPEGGAELPGERRPRPFVPPGAGGRRQVFTQMASVLIAVVAISLYVQFGPRSPAERPVGDIAAAKPVSVVPEPLKKPVSVAAPPVDVAAKPTAPAPVPAPAPVVDRVAVAGAEAELDAASRDRARADHRLAELSQKLAAATSQAALDASRARKLAYVVRDPSTRITQGFKRMASPGASAR